MTKGKSEDKGKRDFKGEDNSYVKSERRQLLK
jgi:hypothetical protein